MVLRTKKGGLPPALSISYYLHVSGKLKFSLKLINGDADEISELQILFKLVCSVPEGRLNTARAREYAFSKMGLRALLQQQRNSESCCV